MSDVSLTIATPDVLIIGAGPVGLALTNDLIRPRIAISRKRSPHLSRKSFPASMLRL
jgi:hypothetical protein